MLKSNQNDDRMRGSMTPTTVNYAAESGDKTVITAPASLRLIVTSFMCAFDRDFILKFKSGGVAISGAFPLSGRTLVGATYLPESFLISLNAAEALAVNVFDTTGAGTVTGTITVTTRILEP